MIEEDFPAEVPKRIFTVWFGSRSPSPNRLRALDKLDAMGVEHIHIEDHTLHEWIFPGYPLHEGWAFLTSIQKADYLRCYLMHHHGGGYSDIKNPSASWRPHFEMIQQDPQTWAVGYPEVRWGVAMLGVNARPRLQLTKRAWWRYRWLQVNHRHLIGNCAFIFRPMTPLTTAWMSHLNAVMDRRLPDLRKRPAKKDRERRGAVEDGVLCDYPLSWTEVGGDVMQPLVLKYRRHIQRDLPAPAFEDYA